jgi:hypothetical protein
MKWDTVKIVDIGRIRKLVLIDVAIFIGIISR